MSRRAQLYSSTSGWNSKHTVVMESLGIPTDDNSTQVYATRETVSNSEHADYGKYIMPVKTDGTWKCDQLFTSSKLVDWDDDWFEQEEPE